MREELQDPSVTTTYLIRFSDDAEQLYKKIKRSSNSGDILCKKSRDLIGQENFWIKTQEPDC